MEKADGLNDYERIRNAKIERNNTKLKECGLLNIVNSFSSLVGSSQGKKRKEKDNARSTNKTDVDYIPDNADGSDDENDSLSYKLPRKVPQSGGRRNVRFIAPRSLKKHNTLSRQGLDLGLGMNHQDVSKKTRHEPQAHLDKVPIPESESRPKNDGKMTMVDLILQKKRSQGENELITDHLSKSKNLTYSTQNMTTTSKRLNINVDDHVSEDDILLRLEGPRKDHFQTRHATQYEKEIGFIGDMPTYSDGEKSLDNEDEDLNSFSMLEPNPDEEYTDEESEQINLTSRDLELDAILQGKIRGPSKLHHIHTRPSEKRKAIILNEFGQPIGPITVEEDTVGEFSRFLGTIGRDYNFAPLVFDSWRKVPNKDKMWQYVLLKYAVPEEGKDWVIKTINDAWRIHKCRFKRKHYYAFKDDRTRWLNRSKTIPDEHFIKLLAQWKKKSEKIRCSRNRDRRMVVKNMHTAGPKSFAVIREDMKNEDPNKEPPCLAKLFERTRKRNEGKKYADSFEDTAKKIENMKNYVAPDDGSGPSDAFMGVMGKENNGRRRLYGRGVCNKKLNKVDGTTMSYVVPGEILESVKANIVDDMRRELDEDHIKKTMVLENMQRELEKERENMQRDLQKERDSITHHVLQNLLDKLPLDVAAKYLS